MEKCLILPGTTTHAATQASVHVNMVEKMNTISPPYLVLASSSTRWAENSLECNNCLQCICYMYLNTHALLLLSSKSIPDSCRWQHMEDYWLTLVQDHVGRVLARPFPKGAVPFWGSMCPLGRPKNQHIFNNYLSLIVSGLQTVKIELDQVALKQVFGNDSYYIQDEGRGHETLFVPFGL